MQQRLPSLRSEPITFAHRGARAHAPENTLAAFELALSMGAGGLETDVWSTKDGIAVLDHDGVVRRGVRRVAITGVDRGSLPAHIPTFQEIVTSTGTGHEFSIDIKSPEAVEALARAVMETGFPVGRLWLCSPSTEVLLQSGRAMPGANLVHSIRFAKINGTLESHVASLDDVGIGTLNMHHSEWTGGHVALCHRFGVNAFAWDIQFEEPMMSALLMGMDGVYSDRVDMMVSVHREVLGGAHPGGQRN